MLSFDHETCRKLVAVLCQVPVPWVCKRALLYDVSSSFSAAILKNSRRKVSPVPFPPPRCFPTAAAARGRGDWRPLLRLPGNSRPSARAAHPPGLLPAAFAAQSARWWRDRARNAAQDLIYNGARYGTYLL